MKQHWELQFALQHENIENKQWHWVDKKEWKALQCSSDNDKCQRSVVKGSYS